MLKNIQILRGLAAMLVVAYHIVNKEAKYGDKSRLVLDWFHMGNSGVDIFFVITGFIMVYITRNKPLVSDLDFIKRFLLKRVIRIFPLYWLFTLLGLCIYVVAPQMVNQNSLHGTSILGSFTLLPTQGWFLVQPGWTLSYEFYFYFLFAISMLFNRRTISPILAVFFIVSCLLRPYLPLEYSFFKLATNGLLLEFLAGMVIGYFYIIDPKWFRWQLGVVSLLASLILFSSLQIFDYGDTSRFIQYGIPSSLLIFAAIALEGVIKAPRVMLLVGDSSYSLYLSHIFVLPAVGVAWNFLNLSAYFNNYGLVFIMFCGAVITGLLSYFFIETKLIHYCRQRVFPDKPLQPAYRSATSNPYADTSKRNKLQQASLIGRIASPTTRF